MSGLLNNTGAVSGVIGTKTAPAIGTGTDGYVFTGTGAGVDPAWEAAAAGGIANTHISVAQVWWSFDQTTSDDTIKSSYGVSTIAQGTTGETTVNYSSAFGNTNYCVVLGADHGSNGGCGHNTPATTSVQVYVHYIPYTSGVVNYNAPTASVACFA